MGDVLTQHVRELHSGVQPDSAFWEELGRELRLCLKRRGIWTLSPTYLDYFGGDWDAVWEDLLQDCYIRAILQPLKTLKRYLRDYDTVLPVIRNNIGFFISERQQQHDPVGRRLFKNLQAAVTSLMRQGVLVSEDANNVKISRATRLRNATAGHASAASSNQLREIIISSDALNRLLPSLAEVGNGARSTAIAVVEHIMQTGVRAFVCGDLMDALSSDLRFSRTGGLPTTNQAPTWEASDDDGMFGRWVRTIGPDGRYEEQESRQALILRVQDAITAAELNSQVKDRIRRLLARLIEATQTGETLSLARLAEEWGMPKSTVFDDQRLLRSLCAGVLNRNEM